MSGVQSWIMETRSETQEKKEHPFESWEKEEGMEQGQGENGKLDLGLNISTVVSSCVINTNTLFFIPLCDW